MIKLSLRSIYAHKFRSFLTMLGIIIGVSSIIIIMSVGAGAQSLITNEINEVGIDKIGIIPGGGNENSPPAAVMGIVIDTLTYDDFLALKRKSNVPNVINGCAYVIGSAVVSYLGEKEEPTLYGVTENFLEIESRELETGDFFTLDQVENLDKVAVLGSETAENLFNGANPIGQLVKIDKNNFRVIGVLQEEGSSGFQSTDNMVVIPLKTAQKSVMDRDFLNYIRLQVDDPDNTDYAVQDIKEVLRERHDIKENQEDDFRVSSAKEGLETFETITNALKYFLAAIAAISLIVGGIGIMNIMIISVNEKINEIGLRRAVGARKADIITQFLSQTIVITLMAGLTGIIFGVLVSYIIYIVANYLDYNWSFVITLFDISLGTIVSIVIGMIFGIYPAIKASKLDPIDALRYE